MNQIIRPAVRAMTLLILLVSCVAPLMGQVPRAQPLPSQRYYNGFRDYYEGDYDRALRIYRSGAAGAFQDGFGRFMDSICYWTMMGECYYQMGAYAEAIEQYEAALGLYASFKAWPSRTTFPEIRANATAMSRAKITWGTPTRQTSVGSFPSQMNVLMGDLDAARKAQQEGGVIAMPNLRPVDITEILRCTALAIYRRNQIKGTTNKHDPFTKTLLAQMSSVQAAGGVTITGAWQGVALGLTQSSMGQLDRAAATLQNSLQINRFDHPLTPIALLELGNIAKLKGDWASAQKFYMEASYTAAAFHQYDVIADAFHQATVVQMIANRENVFQPLAPAAEWARKEGAKALHASLLGDAMWSTAESGAPEQALQFLAQNSRVIKQGDLLNSRVGTQWYYCSALANSMIGDFKDAARDLQRFVNAARNSSIWLYQISLADNLVVNSRVTSTGADVLYGELLRDPTNADWIGNPMETLAYLLSPKVDSMTRWFGIALTLRAEVKALEISDLIRRHRFFSTLPLGGRQLALRWVTSAPTEALSERARQQQADLLTRFPVLKQLDDRSTQLIEQLRKLPVVTERNSDEAREQNKLFDELSEVANAKELVLQALSLRREPCDLAFPPHMSVQQIQDRLGEKQLVIAAFYTGDQYFISLISKNAYSSEAMIQSNALEKLLAQLLKDLGLGESGGTTTVDVLQSGQWRETAKKLSAAMFPRTRPDIFENFDEVIVVPDGPLWYFPFELIQIGSAEQTENLHDRVDVRYAPTLSTVVPDQRLPRRFGKSIVVPGRTNARDDDELAATALTVFQQHVSGAEAIDKSSKTPSSLLSAMVDQIVVWDEIDASKSTNLTLSPMQFDDGREGSGLGHWLQLPWTNVDQLILPGFKSAASGGKRIKSDGQELFLTVCTTLATGTRSMLISRWPVGGQSTMDLTHEFATESLHSSPRAAWRRSVDLLKATELDLQVEPRIRETKMDTPLKADHPLFWASYLLVDLSSRPESAEAEEPVEEPDAPGGDGDEADGDEAEGDEAEGDEAEGDGNQAAGNQAQGNQAQGNLANRGRQSADHRDHGSTIAAWRFTEN